MACRVRDYRAAPSRRNRADSGALAAAPAVHSVAADGRLRVRSASRPLHSQSLSLVGTLSDSSSPSFEGDRVSLQLWGDIILEHLQTKLFTLTTPSVCAKLLRILSGGVYATLGPPPGNPPRAGWHRMVRLWLCQPPSSPRQ